MSIDKLSNNNVESAKDIKKSESRIKLAEERNDPDQVIINISPDIFEKLQNEYYDLVEMGYDKSYGDFLRSKIRVTKANGGLISNYKIEARKPWLQ